MDNRFHTKASEPTMKRRFPTSNTVTLPARDPKIEFWLLTILVPLGGHVKFLARHGFQNEELAAYLGFEHLLDTESFEPRPVLLQLRKRYNAIAKRHPPEGMAPILRQNAENIAALVGLDAIERQILEFVVQLHGEQLLDEAADMLGEQNSVRICYILAMILGVSKEDIQERLSPSGTLARTGLVRVDRGARYQLRSKLELICHGFAERMMSSAEDPVNLFRGSFGPAKSAALTLNDFEHVRPTLDILIPHLRRALQDGRHGVNVLIHGVPGTGKSELSRTLGEACNATVFEVASEDRDGDPIKGELRLRSFSAAQALLTGKASLLVFDEAEDVFSDGDGFFGRKSTAQLRKAWVNRLLEENKVPGIWLSNSIDCIDPAFIRRFDVVLHLDIPPLNMRTHILQKTCGDLVEASTIKRLSQVEHLAPAVVARAASVVRAVHEDLGGMSHDAALEHLVDSTLVAQRHTGLQKRGADDLPDYYDPAFINANADLSAITEGIRQAGSARICLFGPPGTGKTAYGRWLAEQLGIPLLVKRASDLLSMWIGGTEKNIAKAFRDATADKALLLIDEVDSFLQDRRGASRSWEVTAVNEMLTQVESFGGVFIASTNLMGGLDQASLRRFDLKVKLDFMRPEQSSQLLCRQCEALGIEAPGDIDQRQLRKLTQLTPGDFAAIARQNRFRPFKNAAALVESLAQECAAKEGGAHKSIGFHA
jgi:SpoVK/Ycf46/Vps4 family AAA+-type ATPase